MSENEKFYFFYTRKILLIPNVCGFPPVQQGGLLFNPDTIYLELGVRYYKVRRQLRSPHPKSQVVTRTADRPAIKQGSHKPVFGFDNFLEWPTILRELTDLFYNKGHNLGYR